MSGMGPFLGTGGSHRLAEILQRLTQIAPLDTGDAVRHLFYLFRLQRPQLRPQTFSPFRQRALFQGDTRNGAVAEDHVDTFDQHRNLMLDFQGRRSGNTQMQRAATRGASGENHLFRSALQGQHLADNRRPIADDARFGESATAQRLVTERRRDSGQPGEAADTAAPR